MWNKDQNSPATGAQTSASPASRPAPVYEARSTTSGAFIGQTMQIKGEIFSSEELHIDGEVTGKLEAKNKLTIGVTARQTPTLEPMR